MRSTLAPTLSRFCGAAGERDLVAGTFRGELSADCTDPSAFLSASGRRPSLARAPDPTRPTCLPYPPHLPTLPALPAYPTRLTCLPYPPYLPHPPNLP
jgi:hypothetical protein